MSSATALTALAAYAKRHSFLITPLSFLVFAACASAPPAPAPPPPVPAPAIVSKPVEEAVIGAARVVTNALNVRSAPSLEGEILTQIKKNDRLAILQSGDDWIRIRLADGTIGWVSRALVAIDGARVIKPRKPGCPVDSDFHFAKTPTPAFSDSSRHGLVVVEAYVNTKGDVVSTKLLSNSTGDDSLAFLAQREVKEAKFVAPVRNCVAREFIFTYRRSF
jgi:Bacterial SH3 domain